MFVFWSNCTFLAVQNSSGDLVTDSLTQLLTFTSAIQRAILATIETFDQSDEET